MIRLFWVDGRFSWALVVIVAYLSVVLLVVDYVWRVVVVEFDAFLLYALTIALSLFVLIVVLPLQCQKRAE
jgi:hypothetical protein